MWVYAQPIVNPQYPARSDGPVYRFGPYDVDVSRLELRKLGHRLKLEKKPWQLLLAMVERPGEVISRGDLQDLLWPNGLHVDFEKGLAVAMTKLRAALDDSAEKSTYIETLAGTGYRFVGPVERVSSKACQAREGGNGSEQSDAFIAEAAETVPETSRGLLKGKWRAGLLVCIAAVALGLWLMKGRSAGTRQMIHPAYAAKAQAVRRVYVADYSQNAVLGYSVNPVTGMLDSLPGNPHKSGEHPYGTSLSPDRAFLYVVNRGRADGACGEGCNISGYAVDHVSGGLVELDGSPFEAGDGPVAMAINPLGNFVYVANVISNDLYIYVRETSGSLRKVGSVPLGTHPFYVMVSPSGHYLYVTNQDDATISGFALGTGDEMKPIPGSPFATGLRPRSISIDPSEDYIYVLNYGVNPLQTREAACVGEYGGKRGRGCSISVFALNHQTGSLSEIPNSPFESDGTNPLASMMDEAGKYLFVANVTSNDVSVFEVNHVTGAIHRVKGSPFPTSRGPCAIALDWSEDYLYVLSGQSHNVTQFTVQEDGRLTQLGGSIPAGLGPIAIAAQRGSSKQP